MKSMTYKHTMRVRFSEVDKMSVVYAPNYHKYFEEGRCALLREHDFPYSKLEALGIDAPLTKAGIEYKAPLVYDEVFTVNVTVGYVKNFSLKFVYEILKEDGTPACTGFTEHALLNREDKDFAEIPEGVRSILEKYCN